jgi:hypothetical protein
MEWCIPVQHLEAQKVGFGPLHKHTLPFHYTDNGLHFQHLTLLLPIVTVKSYDVTTGRLSVTLHGPAGCTGKLQSLQDAILLHISAHQSSLFGGSRGMDELRAGFQSILHNNTLQLYCPVEGNDIQLYRKGGWTALQSHMLHEGQALRIVLRITGVSFHQHPVSGVWTGKFRLQHRILAMIAVG